MACKLDSKTGYGYWSTIVDSPRNNDTRCIGNNNIYMSIASNIPSRGRSCWFKIRGTRLLGWNVTIRICHEKSSILICLEGFQAGMCRIKISYYGVELVVVGILTGQPAIGCTICSPSPIASKSISILTRLSTTGWPGTTVTELKPEISILLATPVKLILLGW